MGIKGAMTLLHFRNIRIILNIIKKNFQIISYFFAIGMNI